MLFSDSCTVYRINGDGGYDRFYIPECFWGKSNGVKLTSGGYVRDDSIIIRIPEKHAESTPKTPLKDLIVKGRCDFEFGNFSPASVSADMREFREKYQFATVTGIDERLYGRRLRHIGVTAV